jgi:RNA polymerase sigma factor (sigma-70 family)
MLPAQTIQQTVDHLFRHESGKMVSVLSKLLGLQNMEAAQDIVQDALVQAMKSWSYNGLPDNPQAWLHRVAKNKAIDYLRRERKFREISPQYGYLLKSEYTLTPTVNKFFLEDEIQDSQLRMIFACCHPSIAPKSQTALALKVLCGLSVGEIARSFLTNEETIAKKIYRAKEKFKSENIELDLPPTSQLPQRLDGVLRSLYLLFSEGYNSSHPDYLIREDLCEEAIRLCYLLTLHTATNQPRTNALLSLMCFQASRLRARLDDKGSIILLQQQDRTSWYRPLIEKGFIYLEKSFPGDDVPTSNYHLEAVIASLHAEASSFEATDWKTIYSLYDVLHRRHNNPVVALNKAIAATYALDVRSALEQMLAIKELEKYYLYHTAVGELYFKLNDREKAKEYFHTALSLTASKQERGLLESKLEKCGQHFQSTEI